MSIVLAILACVLSITTLVIQYRFNKSHTTDGFVRLPAHLREKRIREAYEADSLTDRTVATRKEPGTGSHVRTARMRGRRMQ